MAESTLYTQEDMESIVEVLQVAPHQKNTQFSSVEKSEEGDLVSLDELYEKTGQEAINNFIKGFHCLTEHKKLSRAHGLALNIKGAENWIPLPDKMNYYKGAEGFLSSVAKGIKAIVKAICNFVKGVCVWIGNKLKALFGFNKIGEGTIKEANKILDSRDGLYLMLNKPGAYTFTYKDVKYPNPPHNCAAFKNYKISIAGNDVGILDFCERLNNAYMSLDKNVISTNKIAKWFSKLYDLKIRFNGMLTRVKVAAKNNLLRPVDAVEFHRELNDMMKGFEVRNEINEAILQHLTILKPILLLGGDNSAASLPIQELRNKNKQHTKIEILDLQKYQTVSESDNGELKLYKHMLNTITNCVIVDHRVSAKQVKGLSDAVDPNDSDLIVVLDELDHSLGLPAVYTEFCNIFSLCSQSLDYLITEIKDLGVNFNSVVRWIGNIEKIIVGSCVEEIIESIKNHKTLGVLANKDLNPDILDDYNNYLYKSSNGKALLKVHSEIKYALWKR